MHMEILALVAQKGVSLPVMIRWVLDLPEEHHGLRCVFLTHSRLAELLSPVFLSYNWVSKKREQSVGIQCSVKLMTVLHKAHNWICMREKIDLYIHFKVSGGDGMFLC